YVVSGRVAGQTDTMPLRVERLFQEYDTPAAFAVASLLTILALVTLALKVWSERRARAQAEGTKTGASWGRTAGSASATSRHSTTSAWRCRRARYWRCWGRRAAARRRCCASSPGWSSPTAGRWWPTTAT